MSLHSLQQRLQSIYEIETGYDVEQFVFSDRALALQLEPGKQTRDIPEKLLVHEHADGMDISLYLDSEMLARLKQDNPHHCLHTGNFADFCTVTEGISHFVYLVWNASFGRSVSLFELELQAEVDKYVMAAALLAEQMDGTLPHNLPHALFSQTKFDPQLNHLEQQRYRAANTYARQYCHSLHGNLQALGDSVLITREIRRFYRLLRHKKIQRIAQLPQVH